MKLYEIVIKPQGPFGTPLKGDTIFGHFCWQAAYDSSILDKGLDWWIGCYEERPFAVFSSAFPYVVKNGLKVALKRPDVPLRYLFPDGTEDREKRMRTRKENKCKTWILVGDDLKIDLNPESFCSEKIESSTFRIVDSSDQCGEEHFCTEQERSHNTINRLTGTTGSGMFAPFSTNVRVYQPFSELVVFVLIDEEATDIDRVRNALERIGMTGFGCDASTGNGRFILGEDDELEQPNVEEANACYALAPFVPEKDSYSDLMYTPFTRYGRHGDRLARSGSPFKNPVVMADEGAVLVPRDKDFFSKPYMGRAVKNLSKADPRTVHQGYAPYLPFRLEI